MSSLNSKVFVISNILDYWFVYKSEKPNGSRGELVRLKELMDSFGDNDIKGLYDYILYENPWEYIDVLRGEIEPRNLYGWKKEATLNLSTKWLFPQLRDELLLKLSEHLKNTNEDSRNKVVVDFVDIFFGDNDNGCRLYREAKYSSIDNYKVSNINYSALTELIEIDLKYGLGLKNKLLARICEIDLRRLIVKLNAGSVKDNSLEFKEFKSRYESMYLNNILVNKNSAKSSAGKI